MSDDLSTVDARQLEAWAYGREAASSEVAAARAEAAHIELARRADAARAEAALSEAALSPAAGAAAGQTPMEAGAPGDPAFVARGSSHEGDDSEHPESPESAADARHRRRMRATGIVGVVAAVLGLGVVSTALSMPDPDPLAIFDRPETQEDRDWATRLAQGFTGAISLGPRALDLGDGIVAVAFRTAAVADGRSTEFDPYCLVTSDLRTVAGADAYGGTCALPEQFAATGLAISAPTPSTGDGIDTVTWGPTGAPRIATDDPRDDAASSFSVLDGLVYASFSEPGADPLAIVEDPDRLLLGPAPLFLSNTANSLSDIETVAYLLGSTSDSAGPSFCAHTTVPDEGETSVCTLLSTVRRQGLEYTVTSGGQELIVSIGADGPNRQDTLRLEE